MRKKLTKAQFDKLRKKVLKFKDLPLARALELKRCAMAIGDPDDDWARYAMWKACIAALGIPEPKHAQPLTVDDEAWRKKAKKAKHSGAKRVRRQNEVFERMCDLLERRARRDTMRIDPRSVPSAKRVSKDRVQDRPGFKPAAPRKRRARTDTMVLEALRRRLA